MPRSKGPRAEKDTSSLLGFVRHVALFRAAGVVWRCLETSFPGLSVDSYLAAVLECNGRNMELHNVGTMGIMSRPPSNHYLPEASI